VAEFGCTVSSDQIINGSESVYNAVHSVYIYTSDAMHQSLTLACDVSMLRTIPYDSCQHTLW